MAKQKKQSCQLVSIGGDKCCPFCLLFDFEIKTFESKCHFHAVQSLIHSCYRINIICIENDLFNLVFVGGELLSAKMLRSEFNWNDAMEL